MTDSEILALLKLTGHLDYPFGELKEVLDSDLQLTQPLVEHAIASYQDFHVAALDCACLDEHSRPARCNGEIGPATRKVMAARICGCEDYGAKVQPVVGTGSWKECHGIGKFHSATVYVHEEDMPSFLKPKFEEIWERVVGAYDEIGLRFTRVKSLAGANIDFQFVNRGAGWIGLAIVGQRQSCASQIWCRYVKTWKPSDIVVGWTELIIHELGHNTGLQHSRGGFMNASLLIGGEPTWAGDPSESILRRLYGGVPIPGDDPPMPPGPPGEEDPRTFSGVLPNRLGEKVDVIIRPREVPK